MLQDVCVGMKDLITGASLATFPPVVDGSAWGVELSRMKDNPDRLIMIEQSGGFSPEPDMAIDYPSVQIMLRGNRKNGSREVKAKSLEIKNLLLGLSSRIIAGDEWASVTMTGEPIALGYDEEDRYRMSLNFNLIIFPGDLGNRRSC